ncbi:DUF1643 domain-containing protein [Levilactobacillus fuyuanensis]|uniref:DUF1643 domain-containing protein n=1 Tax=Levilactobacillus fuyuanensis TaxID=2486022 RepID=A0ABW4H2W3_9LACO|nr:DUF1643 domain-containing protein [Levilactobacillus fuyuanensis]
MDYKYSYDVDSIKCDPISNTFYRYELQILLKTATSDSKEAIVLMMNPSNANGDTSDATTNQLLMCRKYNKFTIFNILPFSGQATELPENDALLKQVKGKEDFLKTNHRKIINYINSNKNADILFATGQFNRNCQRAVSLREDIDKDILKMFYTEYNSICEFAFKELNDSNRIHVVSSCGKPIKNGLGRHPSRSAFDIQEANFEESTKNSNLHYKLKVKNSPI